MRILFLVPLLGLLVMFASCVDALPPQPSQVATTPPLTVSLSPMPTPVVRGATVEIQALTRPGAQSVLVITGPGGTALETKTADSAGHVSWTWQVPRTMTDGAWMVNIKSSYGNEVAFDTTHLTVQTSIAEANAEANAEKRKANDGVLEGMRQRAAQDRRIKDIIEEQRREELRRRYR